jgi:hypothetical protein
VLRRLDGKSKPARPNQTTRFKIKPKSGRFKPKMKSTRSSLNPLAMTGADTMQLAPEYLTLHVTRLTPYAFQLTTPPTPNHHCHPLPAFREKNIKPLSLQKPSNYSANQQKMPPNTLQI